MSVEVAAMTYTFTEGESQRMRPAVTRRIFGDPWRRRDEHAEGGLTKKEPITLQWFYNPVHDLESVIWLFFYFLLHRDVYLRPILPRLSKNNGTCFALSISIPKLKQSFSLGVSDGGRSLGRNTTPPASPGLWDTACGTYQSAV